MIRKRKKQEKKKYYNKTHFRWEEIAISNMHPNWQQNTPDIERQIQIQTKGMFTASRQHIVWSMPGEMLEAGISSQIPGINTSNVTWGGQI